MEEELFNAIKDKLKVQEGFRQRPYTCTQGYLTIGYGRNLETRGINETEADLLLGFDVHDVYNQVKEEFPWFEDMKESAQEGLINMTFQLGLGGVKKFKNMLYALEHKNYEEAAFQAMDSKWFRQTPSRAKYVADKFREV